MTEYRVGWVIEIDADTAEEAAQKALAIHRDPNSIAPVFTIGPRCACGEFHVEDTQDIDLTKFGKSCH